MNGRHRLDLLPTRNKRQNTGNNDERHHWEQHERATGAFASFERVGNVAREQRDDEHGHVVHRVDNDGSFNTTREVRERSHDQPKHRVVRPQPWVGSSVRKCEQDRGNNDTNDSAHARDPRTKDARNVATEHDLFSRCLERRGQNNDEQIRQRRTVKRERRVTRPLNCAVVKEKPDSHVQRKQRHRARQAQAPPLPTHARQHREHARPRLLVQNPVREPSNKTTQYERQVHREQQQRGIGDLAGHGVLLRSRASRQINCHRNNATNNRHDKENDEGRNNPHEPHPPAVVRGAVVVLERFVTLLWRRRFKRSVVGMRNVRWCYALGSSHDLTISTRLFATQFLFNRVRYGRGFNERPRIVRTGRP